MQHNQGMGGLLKSVKKNDIYNVTQFQPIFSVQDIVIGICELEVIMSRGTLHTLPISGYAPIGTCD